MSFMGYIVIGLFDLICLFYAICINSCNLLMYVSFAGVFLCIGA